MWNRSAQNKTTGLIKVVCTDWNGETFFTGEFDNLRDAEEAGQDAERRMTNQMNLAKLSPVSDEISEMSDDELLAELGI